MMHHSQSAMALRRTSTSGLPAKTVMAVLGSSLKGLADRSAHGGSAYSRWALTCDQTTTAKHCEALQNTAVTPLVACVLCTNMIRTRKV